MTRTERSRAVLAQRRHRLRKRYAVLAVVLAVPAMAGATDWGDSSPALARGPAAARRADLTRAVYTATAEPVLGDPASSFADQATAPGPVRSWPRAAGPTAPAPSSA